MSYSVNFVVVCTFSKFASTENGHHYYSLCTFSAKFYIRVLSINNLRKIHITRDGEHHVSPTPSIFGKLFTWMKIEKLILAKHFFFIYI